MEWLVQLIGNTVDLGELSNSLKSAEFSVIHAEDAYLLKSKDFNDITDPDAVLKRAGEILTLINGGAKLAFGARDPLQIAHVVRIDKDGKRNIYTYVSDQVIVRAIPNVLYLASDGTVKEIRAADVVPGWLLAGQKNPAVAKVLRLFGTGGNDWVSLYRIYEVIEADAEGVSNIQKQGWTTKKAIKRFKHTANSPGVIGDEARHGNQKTKPPRNPMLFTEAKSLIESITKNWLRSKT